MKGTKPNLFFVLLRGFSVFSRLAFYNNEFLLFWLIGVLLHVIIIDTFNFWAWLTIGVLDLIVGVAGIMATIRGVEHAFAIPSMSFDPKFGLPRWVLGSKPYPCLTDTIAFTACGHPASTYQTHVAQISARLELPIKEIQADSIADRILHAHILRTKLPSRLNYCDIEFESLAPNEVFYGLAENGPKKSTLRDMVHILVAGQTGGGKTVFCKQLTLTALARAKGSQAVILDMKGGIDFQGFKALKNCSLFTTINSAHKALDRLWEIYELRKQFLSKSGKEHWYDLTPQQLKSDELSHIPTGPLLVLADELAELTGARSKKDEKENVHHRLSQLGRLARATGFHMIMGTQRPDRTVVDGQVKDSLVTRVCFSVPSIAASTIAVNDKSAYTLGQHKGRAVFRQRGPSTVIQTPWIKNEDIQRLIALINARYDREKEHRPIFAQGTDPQRAQGL